MSSQKHEEPPERPWVKIARELAKETNHNKILDLADKLDHAMEDDRQKRLKRITGVG